ncbi:MAG: ParB N-terminal domain-containing protein [Pseudomonadota bacterium]
MSRKRRIFDIDMPSVEEIPEVKLTDRELGRRGPMASAISENAEALKARRETEDAIRAENDRLAHELVRLRKEGLVTERIPLGEIFADKLTRDRAPGEDAELEELKASIRDIGLSNPIRVEPRADGGYELVQGMRRLSAYRALLADTEDARFAEIPAAIQPSDDLADSYRRMVDENLIRKDISFAEMAQLARAYVEDPVNACPEVDKAVALLFKSASYTKRSYIRAFAELLMRLGPVLAHAPAIPRNLGVELKRRMDTDADLARVIREALRAAPARTAEEEVAILRRCLGATPEETLPVGKVAGPARKARTTFDVAHGTRVAKCAASVGRVELKTDVDFSNMDRVALERAVAAFLAALDET